MGKFENYNPPTATDTIIEVYDNGKMQGIVLIKRRKDPHEGKWALPGGFQEALENLEDTAVRENREETTLEVTLLEQLKVYSGAERDPREPGVNSVGYVATATGTPQGKDDAIEAKVFTLEQIYAMTEGDLAFDHRKRIEEYKQWKENKLWNEFLETKTELKGEYVQWKKSQT